MGFMPYTRRDFLKFAASAGLAVTVPWIPARAQTVDAYEGPLWVFLSTTGGWDTTAIMDPKGRASESEANPTNLYLSSEIDQAGAIQYAPIGGNREFFEKHHERLLVINGVDNQTNNHEVGRRYTWSGGFTEGHPNLGALIAGALAPDLSLAFISNGGYDFTASTVPLSRVTSESLLELVAKPNLASGNRGTFHSDYAAGQIEAVWQARQNALSARQNLPAIRSSIGELVLAHDRKDELQRLFEFLPDQTLGGNNDVLRQAQIAMAGYQAGITVSVNISIGGWDTHDNHDARHYPLITQTLTGVDLIIEEAERLGIADRMVLVMGSDFGRTPYYNRGNGKDHWPVSSMMLWGNGIQGNRVIGGTNAQLEALKVNASTLALDDSGIPLTPGHVHQALRKLAGIENSALAAQFPLGVEELDLL